MSMNYDCTIVLTMTNNDYYLLYLRVLINCVQGGDSYDCK